MSQRVEASDLPKFLNHARRVGCTPKKTEKAHLAGPLAVGVVAERRDGARLPHVEPLSFPGPTGPQRPLSLSARHRLLRRPHRREAPGCKFQIALLQGSQCTKKPAPKAGCLHRRASVAFPSAHDFALLPMHVPSVLQTVSKLRQRQQPCPPDPCTGEKAVVAAKETSGSRVARRKHQALPGTAECSRESIGVCENRQQLAACRADLPTDTSLLVLEVAQVCAYVGVRRKRRGQSA